MDQKGQNRRGGYRDGAGRKPSETKLKSVTIRLSPAIIEAVDQRGNRSRIIREAIYKYLGDDRSNNR